MLNCKIKCVECKGISLNFTVGKIYEVKNGKIIDDMWKADENFSSIEQINNTYIAQFELYEEPQAEPTQGNGILSLVCDVHNNAIAHGWYDEQRSFGDLIALCHTELSEAFEEYRNGYKADEVYGKGYPETKMSVKVFEETYTDRVKPEGVPFELADAIIRIFDMCGYYGIDIESAIRIKHKFNKTRPYKHGGKTI